MVDDVDQSCGADCSPGPASEGENEAMATARKAKRPKKKKAARSRFRASWRGQLRFGLVSFAVQAVNAEIKEQGEIHFHLLHAADKQRIHYAKICPQHGEVPNDEIIEGYEYGKDRYVTFEKDEIDELRTDHEKALTVDTFIDPAELDPIYFDGRMYFLIPDGAAAAEAYSVLAAAMEKQDRWGVGQVVFSGREQLAVVRPVDGMLSMAMLSYRDEIRQPADFKNEVAAIRTTARKVKLAEDLIRDWSDEKFDLGQYHDRYRQKVQQMVKAKVEGREVEVEEEDEEPQVVNLMDALQRSVAQTEKRHPRRPHGGHASAGKAHGKRKRRA
jgi:DNA end-binding protein Ku